MVLSTEPWFSENTYRQGEGVFTKKMLKMVLSKDYPVLMKKSDPAKQPRVWSKENYERTPGSKVYFR